MKFLRESEEHFHFETTSKLGNSYGIGFPKEGGHTRESIERALAKIIADTSYKPIDYHWKDLKWDPNTGADYTSSDANAVLPSNAALVAGTQTFSVTLNTRLLSGSRAGCMDQWFRSMTEKSALQPMASLPMSSRPKALAPPTVRNSTGRTQ